MQLKLTTKLCNYADTLLEQQVHDERMAVIYFFVGLQAHDWIIDL